jgi:DNA polymerase-1
MSLFGFDCETYLFQPGLPAPRLVCGSWSDGQRSKIGAAPAVVKFFRWALENSHHLVGVHQAFDVTVLAAYDPSLLPLIFKAGNAGQFHCVAVREALHDIAIDKLFIDYRTGKSFAKGEDMGGRYSQKILMDRHFGIDISAEKEGDAVRFKFASLDGLPIEEYPAEFRDYMLRDASRPVDIFNKQSTHKNLHDEPAQVRSTIAIALMCAWGFRTDPDYIEWLEKEVDGAWNATREEFGKLGVFRSDGSKDMTRLREMVIAAYNGDPPMTKGGAKSKPAVSTDRDTLLDSGDPALERLGAAGKNDKRKTVYIPALKTGIHVPVTPEFNNLVATGRVSSDWQQAPQKGGIREGVIARPGKVNGSLDYGGLELRTMSQRAIYRVGFSKMAEFINKGKCPHAHVVATILSKPYEVIEPVAKTAHKALRDIGKILNFGCGGGAGGGAIAYNAKTKENIRFCLVMGKAQKCGVRKVPVKIQGKIKRVCSVCVDTAKALIEVWKRAWPEQGQLFALASRLTSRGTRVESVTFGSKRVRGGCGYSQWLNNEFQGAGGDGMKAAMWAIQEESYTDRHSPLWGSRILLNIHDELWIESPDEPERRHDAQFRAAEIMVSEMNKVTPDVKNECKPALARRMFKAADTVFDKQGLLKPWWPADWAWAPDSEVMAADRAA